MPKPTAMVDPELCEAEACEGGICPAVRECDRGILVQEAPYEMPYADFSLCLGCFKCLAACPRKAIRKI